MSRVPALPRPAARIAENDALRADKSDPELAALADEEAAGLAAQRVALESELQELMLPRDPNDDKDVFIEIRAGAGGDEAGIFAGDLLRMYTRFADSRKMRVELLSESENEAGGYKEVVIGVKGGEPYRWFKYESGVHRVQRVPATEAAGRIHTSTATVAVLPEVADDGEVEIKPERPRDRHVQGVGCRRPARQQDRVGDPHHAQAERHRRGVQRGALAAAEPRARDGHAARAARGEPAPRARGSRGRAAPQPSRHRRPQREDPHVQLPARPHHRPPHQPELSEHPRDPRRRHGEADRRAAEGREGAPARRRDAAPLDGMRA